MELTKLEEEFAIIVNPIEADTPDETFYLNEGEGGGKEFYKKVGDGNGTQKSQKEYLKWSDLKYGSNTWFKTGPDTKNMKKVFILERFYVLQSNKDNRDAAEKEDLSAFVTKTFKKIKEKFNKLKEEGTHQDLEVDGIKYTQVLDDYLIPANENILIGALTPEKFNADIANKYGEVLQLAVTRKLKKDIKCTPVKETFEDLKNVWKDFRNELVVDSANVAVNADTLVRIMSHLLKNENRLSLQKPLITFNYKLSGKTVLTCEDIERVVIVVFYDSNNRITDKDPMILIGSKKFQEDQFYHTKERTRISISQLSQNLQIQEARKNGETPTDDKVVKFCKGLKKSAECGIDSKAVDKGQDSSKVTDTPMNKFLKYAIFSKSSIKVSWQKSKPQINKKSFLGSLFSSTEQTEDSITEFSGDPEDNLKLRIFKQINGDKIPSEEELFLVVDGKVVMLDIGRELTKSALPYFDYIKQKLPPPTPEKQPSTPQPSGGSRKQKRKGEKQSFKKKRSKNSKLISNRQSKR